MRNFLSFGNNEQSVRLDTDLISVVLGENLDTGGEDSRNACGKSAMVDALCYALFGKTLRDLSNQGLVNYLAGRGQSMSVQVSFDKGKYSYLIERGEKPSKLLLLRKDRGVEEDFYARENRRLKFDQSLSTKADTTKEIVRLLGYNLPLFSYLVTNSSESTPFLKLREDQRREVSESLFGFSILSERAERLKKKRKIEKENLIREETAYATQVSANKRIEDEINSMERRSVEWEKNRAATIVDLEETITGLKAVDFDDELEALKQMAEARGAIKEVDAKLSDLQHRYSVIERDRKGTEDAINASEDAINEAETKMVDLNEGRCPTCKQYWEPDPEYRGHLDDVLQTEPTHIDQYRADIAGFDHALEKVEGEFGGLEEAQSGQQEALEKLEALELSFDSPEEAAGARATMKSLEDALEKEKEAGNPHAESIDGLREKALGEADETESVRLRKLVRHFNFMIELLTSKDSFIRKRIIDQWLPKLNGHIAEYLDILELDYTIEFQPDLSVKIVKFGNEIAWGNLSKGERARVIIALNFSFQDIFEFMNYRINLLCIDELLDNGMCSRVAERAVDLIKTMGAESHKRVLLITHRDDIAARVDHMMLVRKENDLSRIVEVE